VRTKEQFLEEMRLRQSLRTHSGMTLDAFTRVSVEIAFDMMAEMLAEVEQQREALSKPQAEIGEAT
jgi:hypothetical protein